MKDITNNITAVCIMLLILFVIKQIMNYYDVSQDMYYPYFIFYLMLLLCYIILPKNDDWINIK